ncbi:MAG: hypothetical protein ACX939_01680 [Hyphococcus sp.]
MQNRAEKQVETTEKSISVDLLIEIAETLAALVDKENALIENGDVARVAALQDDKESLTRAYRHSIRDIALDRTLLDAAGEDKLRQLRAAASALESRALKQAGFINQPQTRADS